MKKYEVEWRKHGSTNAEYAHQFEASNFEDAWEKASTKHLYGECDYLYVECTNSKVMKRFGNPHHSAYVPPHRTAREKTSHQQHSQQSAPTEQPAGTDGSVGWYENLGESSLSDRDILLAQLHELRTIKRCVVCTILIVIPIVFGVIASA